MFNRTKAITNLYGLVGSQNPANPTYAVIDAANQVTRSGRFFTDNPYAKIEWFIDNTDYDSASTLQINSDLKTLQESAITHICDKVFDKPDYIDRQLLYQNANNKIDTDTLTADEFVGYRIQTVLDKNTAFKITRMLLEFEGTGDITLYLFNTAQKTPIQTQLVTIANTNQSQDLNWVIDYSDVAYYKGDFFIGYLSNEAIVNGLTPVKRNYQNANVHSVITFLNFENIQVPNTSTAELWDLDDIDGADECWGLNPDITVYNDATDLITQNDFIFARAIQLQGQINFLSKIIASRRSNIDERQAKDMVNSIMIELEGIVDTNKIGLKRELLQEINSLKKEVMRLKSGYFPQGFILNTLT